MKTTNRKTIIMSLLVAILIVNIGCQAEKTEAANAEPGTFMNFYKKYDGTEDVTTISLPVGIFGVMIDKEDKDTKELLDQVDNIRIMICEKGQVSEALKDDLSESIPSDLYKDLMVVQEGKDKVEFKIRENNNKVQELLMVISDKSNSLVLLDILGDIDLDKVKKLCKSIKAEDLKGVSKNKFSFSLGN